MYATQVQNTVIISDTPAPCDTDLLCIHLTNAGEITVQYPSLLEVVKSLAVYYLSDPEDLVVKEIYDWMRCHVFVYIDINVYEGLLKEGLPPIS